MAEGITRQEFIELRTMLEETYWMARSAVQVVVGKEKADKAAAEFKRFCDPENRRWSSERALYKVGLSEQNMRPLAKLQEQGIVTLDDVAGRSREDVAAISGVGKVTLFQLDKALHEHGMAWAEVA